jgi:hypothetical protein
MPGCLLLLNCLGHMRQERSELSQCHGHGICNVAVVLQVVQLQALQPPLI